MVVRNGRCDWVVLERPLAEELAEADHALHQIVVDPSLIPMARRLSLTHEMIHVFAPWLDEETVGSLTMPVFMMIADNPEVTRYLQECD